MLNCERDYILENVIQEGLAEKLDKSKLSGFENINPLYQGQFYDPGGRIYSSLRGRNPPDRV